MNNEEENNRQEEMTTPTPEVNLVVEQNSDVLKTLHNLQVELNSFREDSRNERKEQQALNEALLHNMMGGIPQGKPTQSTNRSKRELYHEQASNPREVEKEGTPKETKGVITVLLVMTHFLHGERGKEMMTAFRGDFEK